MDEAVTPLTEAGPEMVDLDDALQRLAALDERQSKIVELRFFGGLNSKDVAAYLDVSPRTVDGDWAMARAWLRRELQDEQPP